MGWICVCVRKHKGGHPPLALVGIVVVGGGESYISLVSRCIAVYGGFSLVLTYHWQGETYGCALGQGYLLSVTYYYLSYFLLIYSLPVSTLCSYLSLSIVINAGYRISFVFLLLKTYPPRRVLIPHLSQGIYPLHIVGNPGICQ